MHTKTYKTRISLLLIAVLVIIPIIHHVPLRQASQTAQITVVYFVLLVFMVVIIGVFKIKYVIDNDTLKIK